MFTYKGLSVWYNSLQDIWMIQDGYDIIGKAKTESAAKAKITKIINNNL